MSRRATALLLLTIAASTPAALWLEGLLRRWLLPPEFEELRDWLRPTLAPLAWGFVGLALLAVVAAFLAQAPLFRGALRRQPATATEGARAARARLETLLLVTSLAQVPALLATLNFAFGAPIAPTLVAIGVGTVGVLAQWVGVERLDAGKD